jgi:hypothetical protein
MSEQTITVTHDLSENAPRSPNEDRDYQMWLANRPAAEAPPPDPRVAVTDATRYLSEQRAHLLEQVSSIEKFLGFAQQADDLAVRVAKLEKFLGIG